MPAIEMLSAPVSADDMRALAELLQDAVEGGASVGFLPPLPRQEAAAFWERAVADLPGRIILVAREAGGGILGSVQLVPAAMPNQAHRADVSKLLVLGPARRRGIARALMLRLEEEAGRIGRSLLTLDTRRGDAAEPLYRGLGYHVAGVIPRYALNAAGGRDDTVVFWKEL